jgi:hypothetical protein
MNLWSRWDQLIEPVSSNGFTMKQFDQLIYPTIKICNFLPGIKLEHKVNKIKIMNRNVKILMMS